MNNKKKNNGRAKTGAGVYSGCHQLRGGVQAGQVTSQERESVREILNISYQTLASISSRHLVIELIPDCCCGVMVYLSG